MFTSVDTCGFNPLQLWIHDFGSFRPSPLCHMYFHNELSLSLSRLGNKLYQEGLRFERYKDLIGFNITGQSYYPTLKLQIE